MSDNQVYDGVIVGTDGSETAERAVRRAVDLAGTLAVPVTLATAWYRDMPDKPVLSELAEWPTDSAGAMEAAWAEQTVSDGAAIARKAGIGDPKTATPQGGPAEGLLSLSRNHPNSLLVVGTVGLGSRAERLLGNVPHQITHHAASDVLLVRSTEGDASGYRTVALATDGSDTAARAVERGVTFAIAIGADVTLLTVARREEDGREVIEKTLPSLPDDVQTDSRVAVGRHTGSVLLDVAPDYDLLVIGNKGMSGPSRLLGSVANEVTHHVPADLLLVNTIART